MSSRRMIGETTTGSLEKNKELARRYLDRISAGDAEGVAGLFAEDGAILVQSSTPFPSEVRGREAIRALMSQLPDAFPETGLKIIIDEVTAEENRVSVVSHTDAIHASGKPYLNRYHFLLYIDDRKIRESHEYLDSLHLNEVLFGDGRQLSNH